MTETITGLTPPGASQSRQTVTDEELIRQLPSDLTALQQMLSECNGTVTALKIAISGVEEKLSPQLNARIGDISSQRQLREQEVKEEYRERRRQLDDDERAQLATVSSCFDKQCEEAKAEHRQTVAAQTSQIQGALEDQQRRSLLVERRISQELQRLREAEAEAERQRQLKAAQAMHETQVFDVIRDVQPDSPVVPRQRDTSKAASLPRVLPRNKRSNPRAGLSKIALARIAIGLLVAAALNIFGGVGPALLGGSTHEAAMTTITGQAAIPEQCQNLGLPESLDNRVRASCVNVQAAFTSPGVNPNWDGGKGTIFDVKPQYRSLFYLMLDIKAKHPDLDPGHFNGALEPGPKGAEAMNAAAAEFSTLAIHWASQKADPLWGKILEDWYGEKWATVQSQHSFKDMMSESWPKQS